MMKLSRNIFNVGIAVMLCCLIPATLSNAQNLTQTIKGVVTDADSHIPLPGATVVIVGSNPLIGTSCDPNGAFKLTGIKVGRYDLKFSFLGYEPAVISEVSVMSGKETVLQVALKESVTALQQVEVKAYSNKEKAINPMAMISARQLNMEEASRYAGGIDDPARLAASFAGVAGNLSSNAIVIRGNAPKGLLWRMEGVEIPNPSHYANITTFGGGGITALSSQMLGNSDFFTGAFPAEYGNAMSGVFDMKMRTGNNEKREYTVKAGLIGVDLSSEGPFVRGTKSSYLFNYRYSTLALISPLLPENAQGLKYQDLAFKTNFVMGKMGSLSIWGLFSYDVSGSKVKDDSTEWNYYQDIEKDVNRNSMGALGISHKAVISNNTYINTTLAATGNLIYWHRKRLDQDLQLYPKNEINQDELRYTASFLVNHKFSARHTNRSGFTYNRLTYNVLLKESEGTDQPLQTFTDEKGGTDLIQLFTQSRIDLSRSLTANLGIHSQIFALNHEATLEPRLSLKMSITGKSSLSVAYGLHSRLEPVFYYLARQTDAHGNVVVPNKNLRLTKAHHLVLAFETAAGKNGRLRIEPFYQWLYDVPVINHSSFSMLNLDTKWFFNDSLVNKGRGYNYGLDITLERFLKGGYYYLATASVFDSRYRGGDGVWHNTRYNRNYVANLLFGKEWTVGRNKNNSFDINGKFSILGGERISPVDATASALAKDVVYNDSRAFANRKPAVYYLDLSASWHRNRPRYSSTWSLQFVNLLFAKENYGHRYNIRTGLVESYEEPAFIPNLSYRVDF